MNNQKAIAKKLVCSLASGQVKQSVLSHDFVFYACDGGEQVDSEHLSKMVKILYSLFIGDFEIVIDSAIEEGDRVAILAHSKGTLKDGEIYENIYHYAIRFRDGKVCEMGEYLNVTVLNELIMPKIYDLLSQQAQ